MQHANIFSSLYRECQEFCFGNNATSSQRFASIFLCTMLYLWYVSHFNVFVSRSFSSPVSGSIGYNRVKRIPPALFYVICRELRCAHLIFCARIQRGCYQCHLSCDGHDGCERLLAHFQIPAGILKFIIELPSALGWKSKDAPIRIHRRSSICISGR